MRRLGRAPHDPAALAAVPQHYATTRPLEKLDRSGIAFTPGLWLNNVIGDCVAVALANSARAAAFVATGDDIVVDPAKVPAAFASWVGCADTVEAMAAVDGIPLLHAYQLAAANGFDVGEQVPLVPEIRKIDTQDRLALASALSTGAVVLGVNLATADDTPPAITWDTGEPAADGSQTRGSWGGHALILWDYSGLGDTDTVRLGTWGWWQLATWRWVHARLDEAYAQRWAQLERAA